MSRQLDLNADLGESFGVYRYGADEALMPLITSANVACGFHAGDPRVMAASVRLAHDHGVRIGAHIGLPDREGFGRRELAVSPADAHALTLYQLGALDAFLRRDRIQMQHVKPHGALYMMASRDPELADAVAGGIADFDPGLLLYALPGSALAKAGLVRQLAVVGEFFADRPYDGSDVIMFGWTAEHIGSPADAADRVGGMLTDPEFDDVGTICVHSDTPDAPRIAAAVRDRLEATGSLRQAAA